MDVWARPAGFIPTLSVNEEVDLLRSYEARPGMTVRVREGHLKPEFDGMLGTIKRSYGHPEYLALDVRLEDGRLELFWHHQLDKV